MTKIVFIETDGTIHTQGTIAYIHDCDTSMEEPEPGMELQELDVILDFVKDNFAPDYWRIENGKIERVPKKEYGK